MPKINDSIVLYGSSFVVVFLIAFLLDLVIPETSFYYSFFFTSWQIQFLSTWLFIVGVFFWWQRFSLFKKERSAYNSIKIPDVSITIDDIPKYLEGWSVFDETLTFRRVRELHLALVFGEDVVRLNEELSRRDMADVERGHLTLDALKNLIPVVGFLGTVIGLSLAMTAFPQVADPAQLKSGLQDFASSLSIAFNTTLLALLFTILIIMMTSFLRQVEETLVSEVDERVRALILRLRSLSDVPTQKDDPEINGYNSQALNDIKDDISNSITETMTKMGESIVKKINELK